MVTNNIKTTTQYRSKFNLNFDQNSHLCGTALDGETDSQFVRRILISRANLKLKEANIDKTIRNLIGARSELMYPNHERSNHTSLLNCLTPDQISIVGLLFAASISDDENFKVLIDQIRLMAKLNISEHDLKVSKDFEMTIKHEVSLINQKVKKIDDIYNKIQKLEVTRRSLYASLLGVMGDVATSPIFEALDNNEEMARFASRSLSRYGISRVGNPKLKKTFLIQKYDFLWEVNDATIVDICTAMFKDYADEFHNKWRFKKNSTLAKFIKSQHNQICVDFASRINNRLEEECEKPIDNFRSLIIQVPSWNSILGFVEDNVFNVLMGIDDLSSIDNVRSDSLTRIF